MQSSFRLPIAYLERKEKLDVALIDDLELLTPSKGEQGPDQPATTSLYTHVLGPETGLGARTFRRWVEYYTPDKSFIKDTQRLVSGQLPAPLSPDVESSVSELWDQLEARAAAGAEVDDFHSQYQFIDWGSLRWLNMQPLFLAILSMYNIGSPVLSLATPIFIMLVPFVVLRLRSAPISMSRYMEILRVAMRSHALGKLFDLGSASVQQKIYIAVSLAFYILQVYQNVRSCIQFCSNLTTVRRHVRATKNFLNEWIERSSTFQTRAARLKSYSPFLLEQKRCTLLARAIHARLPDVRESDKWWEKAQNIGTTMQAFYAVHQDPEIRHVLSYALDWCGFVENVRQIQSRVQPSMLQKCTLGRKKTKFHRAYFPTAGTDAVRNSYGLDKHILVTGPNAAGKTTILKATLFNVLLSQQIGHGFYARAVVAPYDKIHCYINIPDTGGRDSLFQAEARRCRNILAAMENLPECTRHFCVFDELYSGTNPYEAIGSAEAFLRFIGERPQVSFIMTTHFLELCTRLGSHKRIANRHMDARCGENGMEYTYKLEKGVSRVRGGVEVLRGLNYPAKVVEEAAQVVSTLSL